MATRKRPKRSERERKAAKAVIDYESRWLAFGARLRAARDFQALRRGREYSRVELGKEMRARLLATPVRTTGIGRNTVAEWEANKVRPLLEKIVILAEVLDVDPGWLAFGRWYSDAKPPAWADQTWKDSGGEPAGERERRSSSRTDGKLRVGEYPHMVRLPATVDPAHTRTMPGTPQRKRGRA